MCHLYIEDNTILNINNYYNNFIKKMFARMFAKTSNILSVSNNKCTFNIY